MKSLGIVFLVAMCFCASAAAQTTAFTYQGNLKDGASPANGNYDFEFSIWDSLVAGTQQGATQTVTGVAVANGIFTVKLDFGANFPGAARFIEIRVRVAGGGAYTTLSPRQPVTSEPYSIRSENANNADKLSPVCNLCVTDAQISGISGSKVTSPVANATNAINATTAVNVSGVVAIANGGTGSTTKNFVDLSTDQSILGLKTFPLLVQFNNIRLGGLGPQTNLDNTTVSSPVINAVDSLELHSNRILDSALVDESISLGFNAGNANNSNTFLGGSTGKVNTTGASNVFVGKDAGRANTTAGFNTFVGASAGSVNTTGASGVFVGKDAGKANMTGGFNTYIGWRNGEANTNGSFNTFVGSFAGSSNIGGSANTFFGTNAGTANVTGSKNTLIGDGSNVGSGGLTNATAVGANAVVSTSNTVMLGRPADTVIVPNKLQLDVLSGPTFGSFHLCYDILNQVGKCIVTELAEKTAADNTAALDAIRNENRRMLEQLKQQQIIIDGLKVLACSQNPTAAICKEEKK